MRATGRLPDLRAALAIAASVPNNRNTIPILGNARLRLEPPCEIEITTTDLDCEYRARIPAEVEEGGSLTVPAKLLADAARTAGGDDFSISLDMASARFEAGGCRVELPVLPVTDFPDLVSEGEWDVARLPASDLAAIISHALPFVLQDGAGSGANYTLSGVLLTAADGVLNAVATRKSALGAYGRAAELEGRPEGIVPAKAAEIALRLLADGGAAKIAFTQSLVRLTVGDASLTSRLIGGAFPNYQRVVPETFAHVVKVKREALRLALRRAMVVADDKRPFVRATFAKGKLTISCRSGLGFGESTATVDIDYSGPPITTGYPTLNLTGAIASTTSESLEIHLNSAAAAARVVDPADRDKLVLIMPVHIGQPQAEAA